MSVLASAYFGSRFLVPDPVELVLDLRVGLLVCESRAFVLELRCSAVAEVVFSKAPSGAGGTWLVLGACRVW